MVLKHIVGDLNSLCLNSSHSFILWVIHLSLGPSMKTSQKDSPMIPPNSAWVGRMKSVVGGNLYCLTILSFGGDTGKGNCHVLIYSYKHSIERFDNRTCSLWMHVHKR